MLKGLSLAWQFLWIVPAVVLLVAFMLVCLIALGPQRAHRYFAALFLPY